MSQGDVLIHDFVEGRFHYDGKPFPSPIDRIEIAPSLDGREAELIRSIGFGERPVGVVSDEITHELLGHRVAAALGGWATDIVLERPHADEENAALLSEKSHHCEALIAVGSGTLNDLCKHVTFMDGRKSAVFATTPSMNGYCTSTASITAAGYKQSLRSHAAVGVFFDLGVLMAAPPRLIRAGVADTLCRTTAQVDWLLSHLIFDTFYTERPYELQIHDEPVLVERAGSLLEGDVEAMAALVRLLVLGGLGVLLTGTSHSGSMGEHSISHFIDMFADPHPGSLHGEQVGVATMTMARLQEELLACGEAPVLRPETIDRAGMEKRYGSLAVDCIAKMERKNLTAAQAERFNRRLAEAWPSMRMQLLAVRRPLVEIDEAMRAVGAPMEPGDIGLDPAFYGKAVRHAHETRDRFSMLDLADHLGVLDAFTEREIRP